MTVHADAGARPPKPATSAQAAPDRKCGTGTLGALALPLGGPSDDLQPDPKTVRTFLEIIHAQARSALNGASDPGLLQLVRIHPAGGKAITSRFAIGDVDGMVKAALGDAAAGHNVYVEGRTVARGTRKRGTLADTRGVFAFAADADADKGKAGHLEAEPSLIVETSPGNRHLWLFLDKALTVEEAQPIGEAIRAATGADADTGVITQPYRVAGTPNFPSAGKRARGRVATPTRILEQSGILWSREDLLAAFPSRSHTNGAGQGGADSASDASVDELLARCSALYQKTITSPAGPPGKRSEIAFSVILHLLQRGVSEPDIKRLIEAHPNGIGERYASGKDLDADIRRAQKKARAKAGGTRSGTSHARAEGNGAPPTETAEIAELNAKFCVVRDGSRTRVLTFDPDEVQKEHRREKAVLIGFEDFRNLYLNRRVRLPGSDKDVQLGSYWLRHPERRQYEGLTFQPGGGKVVEGRLNLWRGWGVEPKAGDWSLMRRHIEEVLAAGSQEAVTYILNWIAWAVQNPAERAEVALVFKGDKGSGKGTLGNALCWIFGQHGTHISSADHLAGRFNAHLRDACLLFADEAYWPGDRAAEGSLKRLITEPDLFIEAKGRDGISVPNMLHVIMASDEDWVVPAGKGERRFVVLDVAEHRRQDETWFGPLYAETRAGGLGAMLHDLLRRDLGDWHPRRILRTKALLDQQARSLTPEDQWWVGLLEAGVLPASDPAYPNSAVSGEHTVTVQTSSGERTEKRRGLFEHARASSPKLKVKSDQAMRDLLRDWGCESVRVLRRKGWRFPPLQEARAAWERRYPGWTWNAATLLDAEWEPEEM